MKFLGISAHRHKIGEALLDYVEFISPFLQASEISKHTRIQDLSENSGEQVWPPKQYNVI